MPALKKLSAGICTKLCHCANNMHITRSSFEKKSIPIVKKRKFCKNCSYYYCIYENCLKKFILNIYKKIAWKIVLINIG
uniref:Uncharacterized protein n=1 Tax=Strongyloides venezuelensis TaxID=75913 RepID=A0A0K0FSX2_STRVS